MAKGSVEHQLLYKVFHGLPGISAGLDLSISEADTLQRHLMAPVTIARWIEEFAPNMRRRKSLNIVIAGGVHNAIMPDQGRWFQFIPSLLGVSGMKVTVALVGRKPVVKSSSLSEAAMMPAIAALAAASIHDCTIGEFLDASRWQPDPDLVFLFFPSPFSDDYSSWHNEDGIRTVLEMGIPVGTSAPAEEVSLGSRSFNANGYSIERRMFAHPFAGHETSKGDRASGHALCKIAARSI